jgi:dolichol-phosphate mannosyltransferase
MADDRIDLSIIVPVKDEEENVGSLAQEIGQVMAGQSWSWECLWVDDGSQDQSLTLIQDLCRSDPRHRYLSFAENAGQSAALYAAFSRCRGSVLTTLDGDGQNDPADIPKVVEKVLAGEYDMVNGFRAQRRDNLVRKLASRVANRARNVITGKSVRDVGCSTRAFRWECVQGLPRFAGMHRFLPTLVALQGFTWSEVAVNHRPRRAGKSKYSINNRLWVGILDLFGVLWLRKRGFRFRIAQSSDNLIRK